MKEEPWIGWEMCREKVSKLYLTNSDAFVWDTFGVHMTDELKEKIEIFNRLWMFYQMD